ncbi:MAG: glycoside hydrolase family 32 protein [Capsulimonadaceae bacterium]|nr:glycoside hydrolase family 32 protein [Capsulimonadaceae bacterium]
MRLLCIAILMACLGAPIAQAASDIVIADFEGAGYGSWTVVGTAFGSGPAHGALPGQMPVTGYDGKGLANSYHGGDDATGRLISPEFKIERPYLSFLIGGGGFAGETCLSLVVEGVVVRTATGHNTHPGGSERLTPGVWDVRELRGKTAHIEIVDEHKGCWGHICVDNLIQTERRPVLMETNVKRELTVEKRLLHFPVTTGGAKRNLQILADGKIVRAFSVELADEKPEWWAPLDVSAWRGKTISLVVDELPEGSHALSLVQQGDALPGSEDLYREALRPQIHFSAQRGWLNDPNGLVYYNGEYQLFFQHNPYGVGWGNMHWGHAVSRDLVHWQQQPEALYPDDLGTMFSGSAVVDWHNTSGFGEPGKPPVVLIYTAAGNPVTQCIAYSTDGRTFTKYAGNPVLPNISGGNRDPKVVWIAESKRWVMALYVERDGRHTIHIFTSPNLRDWTLASVVPGGGDKDGYLYECPDFYELPLDGDGAHKKWVLSAANNQYAIGSFDGTTFTPEFSRQSVYRGQGFYAPQTYSDEPKQRRVQIGWLQAGAQGMPFSQCMSLPHVITLRTTPDGPRLNYQPAPELAELRTTTVRAKSAVVKPGDANPLANVRGEMLEIDATFTPAPQSIVTFDVRGIPVVYDAAKQEVVVAGHAASAPLVNGKQTLVIYADRTAYEIFASDGFSYAPMPVYPKADALGVVVSVKGGSAKFEKLEAHELKSIWQDGDVR